MPASEKNFKMKNIIRAVSLLFHPMLLTSYAVLLMFILPTYLSLYPYNYKKAVILIIFTATFISPLLILLVLLNLQKIKSLRLTNKRERIFPLFTVFILYVSAWLITLNFPGGTPVYISNFILCSTVIILIVALITIKYKISIYMSAVGGFIGFFYIWFLKINISELLFVVFGFRILSIHFFGFLFLIAGISASSRLMLKIHNPLQIMSGFFVGLFMGLASIVLY